MLPPLNDLPFVACGIATFAATVGYTLAKARRPRTSRADREASTLVSPGFHTLSYTPIGRSSSAALTSISPTFDSPYTDRSRVKRVSSRDSSPMNIGTHSGDWQASVDLSSNKDVESVLNGDGDVNVTSADTPSSSSSTITLVEEYQCASLKRKAIDDDEEDGEYHESSPKKRSRTPSSDDNITCDLNGTPQSSNNKTEELSDEAVPPILSCEHEDYVIISLPTSPLPDNEKEEGEISENEAPVLVESPLGEDGELKQENQTPPLSEVSSAHIQSSLPASLSALPQSSAEPIRPTLQPFFSSRPSPFTANKGFAAFAGASSAAFAIKAEGQSVISASGSPQNKAVWSASVISPVGVDLSGDKDSNTAREEAALVARMDLNTTYTHVTGEEEEKVKLELKGAKLFVKRGQREFSSGMLGHVKLLERRGDSGDMRLLFRREPLWQVSMNVRVRPGAAMRCTFDAEELVLRVIVRESTSGQETVVYALKAGRVPKDEFKKFAEGLVEAIAAGQADGQP